MATPDPEIKPAKTFRIHRFAIGLNVLVQILLLVFCLCIVNYYAFRHYKRWDFSRNQKHVLSGETKQILANLAKPLKLYVFFSPDPRIAGGDVYPDITALLKEYQYASHGKVDVEMIDPYKNLTRARALMDKYKFGNENVVIADYDGHSKLVNFSDMADYDTSGEMYGQSAPKLKAFKGEQAITSAILEVSEEKQNKIYLLAGKGGPDLSGDNLSAFKTFLERQNLKLDNLTLMNVDKIPDDAKTLLLIGARYDLTDRELKLLRDYWEKQGRIFVALDPAGATPKLDAFLAGAGIKPQDDRILRTVAIGPMTGIVRQVTASFSEASPITDRLKGVETQFDGQTKSLAVSEPTGLHTTPLITAAEGYWGETEYQNMEQTGVFFDPKKDVAPPLTVAASAEKGGLPDNSVKVDTSRMVVVGNSAFVENETLNEANVDFVLAALNWMLNREELIGIAPKSEERFTLNLTDEQLHKIEVLVLLVIPAVVAMAGGVMWTQRRR